MKFSLHAPCSSPPNIQVTLLKQNASGIGKKGKRLNSYIDVDKGVNFNINTFQGSSKGNESCYYL